MIEVEYFWRQENADGGEGFPIKAVPVDLFGDKLRLFLMDADTVHISGLDAGMVERAVAIGKLFIAVKSIGAHPSRVSAVRRHVDSYEGPWNSAKVVAVGLELESMVSLMECDQSMSSTMIDSGRMR